MYAHPYGERPDWTYVQEERAAQMLGVGVELVRGLCSQGHIEAFLKTAKSGRELWLVRESEIPKLAEKMAGVGRG